MQNRNCNYGCGADTTPCPQSSWVSKYPAYGLNWAQMDRFSFVKEDDADKAKEPFYFFDYLDNIILSGSPLNVVRPLLQQSPIAQLMLDINVQNSLRDPDGATLRDFPAIFKAFPEQYNVIQNGRYFEWLEMPYTSTLMEFYIIRDEASETNTFLIADKYGNPIDMNSHKYKGTLVKGLEVSVYYNDPEDTECSGGCCANFDELSIQAVGTTQWQGKTWTTLTVEGWSGSNEVPLRKYKGRNNYGGNTNIECLDSATEYADGKYPGDKVVVRTFAGDFCNTVAPEAGLDGYVAMHSPIQKIAAKICWDWDDLHMRFTNNTDASLFFRLKVQATINMLVNFYLWAFYVGKGRDWGNELNIEGSTMSLYGTIYDAQAHNPMLGLIKSAINATTTEEQIEIWLSALNKARYAKYGKGQLVCLFDKAGYEWFLRIKPALNNLLGVTEVINSGQNNTISIGEPMKVVIGGKQIEIVTDTYYDSVTQNAGECVIFDKSLIWVRQPDEFTFDIESGKLTSVATMWLRVSDKTDPTIDEPESCKCLQLSMKFANIFIAVTQQDSPYCIVEGLRNRSKHVY